MAKINTSVKRKYFCGSNIPVVEYIEKSRYTMIAKKPNIDPIFVQFFFSFGKDYSPLAKLTRIMTIIKMTIIMKRADTTVDTVPNAVANAIPSTINMNIAKTAEIIVS